MFQIDVFFRRPCVFLVLGSKLTPGARWNTYIFLIRRKTDAHEQPVRLDIGINWMTPPCFHDNGLCTLRLWQLFPWRQRLVQALDFYWRFGDRPWCLGQVTRSVSRQPLLSVTTSPVRRCPVVLLPRMGVMGVKQQNKQNSEWVLCLLSQLQGSFDPGDDLWYNLDAKH